MADEFLTKIDKFVVDTEAKMLAVVRNSIDMLVEDAQTPGPSKNYAGEGGKMKVDTGFLRSTGLAKIGGVPTGPSNERVKDGSYKWNGEQVEIVLGSLKIGDDFYFGWSANYARYRETYDGFLASAIQNWQSYINASIQRLKK